MKKLMLLAFLCGVIAGCGTIISLSYTPPLTFTISVDIPATQAMTRPTNIMRVSGPIVVTTQK